jgi:hypothetical protein
MRGSARGILVAAALLALAPVARADEPSPAAPERLSDPGHVSRWAFVVRKAIARANPDPGSKAVTRVTIA